MDKNMTRREFLQMGTKAALSIVAVTACGELLTLQGQAQAAQEEIAVGPDRFLAEVDDLKEKIAVNFIYQGKKSILLYNGGEIRAFENICTHRGGPNKLTGNRLVCQWHGAVFDPLTGKEMKPPAPKGSILKAIGLDIRGKEIFVK